MEAKHLVGWAWAMDGIRVHYLPRRAWKQHQKSPFHEAEPGGDLYLPEDLCEHEVPFVCRSLGAPTGGPDLTPLGGIQRLHRVLFERGVAHLVTRMPTFSQADFDQLPTKRKAKFALLRARLGPTSRPLRDRLGLASLKSELDEARRLRNLAALATLEYHALVRVHEALGELPWNADDNLLAGSDPFSLSQTKAMACIGHAILGHAFLKELNITHWVAVMNRPEGGDDHLVLRVRLADGRGFHLDPQEDTLFPVHGAGPREGAFTLDPSLRAQGITDRLLERDAPSLLQGSLMALHGFLLNRQGLHAEALPWQWEGLRLLPGSPANQVGTAFTLYQLGRYQEALVYAQKGVEGAPGDEAIKRFYLRLRRNVEREWP